MDRGGVQTETRGSQAPRGCNRTPRVRDSRRGHAAGRELFRVR